MCKRAGRHDVEANATYVVNGDCIENDFTVAAAVWGPRPAHTPDERVLRVVAANDYDFLLQAGRRGNNNVFARFVGKTHAFISDVMPSAVKALPLYFAAAEAARDDRPRLEALYAAAAAAQGVAEQALAAHTRSPDTAATARLKEAADRAAAARKALATDLNTNKIEVANKGGVPAADGGANR
jgi:hypothetical protein